MTNEPSYAVYVDRFGEDHLVCLSGYALWYGGRQRRWRIALIDDQGNQIGRARFVEGGAITHQMTIDEARRFIADRKEPRDA